MKVFVCLVALVTTVHAGFLGSFEGGHYDDGPISYGHDGGHSVISIVGDDGGFGGGHGGGHVYDAGHGAAEEIKVIKVVHDHGHGHDHEHVHHGGFSFSHGDVKIIKVVHDEGFGGYSGDHGGFPIGHDHGDFGHGDDVKIVKVLHEGGHGDHSGDFGGYSISHDHGHDHGHVHGHDHGHVKIIKIVHDEGGAWNGGGWNSGAWN